MINSCHSMHGDLVMMVVNVLAKSGVGSIVPPNSILARVSFMMIMMDEFALPCRGAALVRHE